MINTTLPRSPGLIVMQYFNQIPHMNICAVITIYITCQSACRSNDVYEFAKNPRVAGWVGGWGGWGLNVLLFDATPLFSWLIYHTLYVCLASWPPAGWCPGCAPRSALRSRDGHTHQSLCWPSRGCGWPPLSSCPSASALGCWTRRTSRTPRCCLVGIGGSRTEWLRQESKWNLFE